MRSLTLALSLLVAGVVCACAGTLTIEVGTSDPLVPSFDVVEYDTITGMEVVTCEGECPADILDASVSIESFNCSGALAPGEPAAVEGSYCIEWRAQGSDVYREGGSALLAMPILYGADNPLAMLEILPDRALPAGEHVVRMSRQVGAFNDFGVAVFTTTP